MTLTRMPSPGSKALPLIALATSSLLITSCTLPRVTPSVSEAHTPPSATPDSWTEALYLTPYPYSTPLPPAQSTPLDGLYVRFDPREGTRAPCRRCPPYPPEGGTWLLHLDQGVFRVYHEGTEWRTLGSFTVSDDRIAFFNDPHCIHEVGVYLWDLTDSQLLLELVSDECGQELRAGNLTSSPWAACRSDEGDSALTQPTPEGCRNTSPNPEHGE